MNQEALLKALLTEVLELKAMISQLVPVSVQPTIEDEIAAVEAQGISIIDYFKAKGRAAVKADKRREVKNGPIKDAGQMA